MSAQTRVRVAVAGCGYWGPNLIRNFADHPESDLVIACDAKPERLASIRRRYPACTCTTDFDEALAHPLVEAVALATPVSSHFRLARRALEAGKHVLVEKPLATSVREAKVLVELARRRQRVLMAGHTFVYSPPVRKVKELLGKKTLGRIYTMDFSRVNLGLFQPDVNVLWDLAPHDVSIALYWLGRPPLSVRAQAKNFVRRGIQEVGYLSLEFPGGIWVHLHVSWLAPVKLRRVVVVGASRMLVYDDTENTEKVKIYDQGVVRNPETFGEFQLTYRTGDIHSPKLDSTEPLALEVSDFLRAIRTGAKPVSDAAFGLEVVRVLEAAQRSLELRGATVRL